MGPGASLGLKLVLTPLLAGAASLAGRKWAPEIGGWLVGIPFTSGPIAFFLALSAAAPLLGPHLPSQGIAIPFAAAIVVALALRGLSLALGRRMRPA